MAHQKPEVLAALRQQAIVQSAESSDRIEGVIVPAARLRPLVLGKARPRDRCEEELSGYHRALNWIFSRRGRVAITPAVIRKLHAQVQGGESGEAGKWKTRDNEIIEFLPNGNRRTRFQPISAKETPRAMELLCEQYRRTSEQEAIPALILVATFVLDFLCIHPFRNGNGRVSRLATALLLQSQGFEVSRYISLERLVEETKEDYYRVIGESSVNWRQGRNPIEPWWNYFLGIVRSGYKEFEFQIENVPARAAKSGLVSRIILEQAGEFTLGDVIAQTGSVSPQLVKKVLSDLKAAGQIELHGRGRGARWKISA